MIEVNRIYCGDSLEILKSWPDEFVDCVITSPPYWGLRDYGTAKWEGQDPDWKEGYCDHSAAKEKSRYDYSLASSPIQDGERKGTDAPKWKDVCPRCGAKKVDKQVGLEPDHKDYIKKLCDIFDEAKRVLKKEGSLWVNVGDTYCAGNVDGFIDATDSERIYQSVGRKKRGGDKEVPRKSLMQIPARFVLEMLNRGWTNRNEIIWYKPACMPTSAEDRFTIDFEKIFFFTKQERYYFEQQKEKAVWDLDGNGTIKRAERQREGLKSSPDEMKNGIRKRFTYPNGKYKDSQQSPKTISGFRNKRCVWKVNTKPYHEAHFATFPELLIETPIKAGSPKGGIVLDPFMGAGTTAVVAKKLGRKYLGIELNPKYIEIAEQRIKAVPELLF